MFFIHINLLIFIKRKGNFLQNSPFLFLNQMKFDKKTFKNILIFLVKNIKWLLSFVIIILLIVNIRSCSKIHQKETDNIILENNILAMNDTLKNYKDKNGFMTATMRALQLRINDLNDSLKIEKGKTPITITQYVTNVTDTFFVQSQIKHDTVYIINNYSDCGVIKSYETNNFGKSYRTIEINTPYYVNLQDGMLYADGESTVILDQNIWVENVIYKDKKGYTYLKLKTDYPNITFNSGTAILVLDPKEETKQRKQFGLGIGLQLGYGVTHNNGFNMSPYLGIGINVSWNPKFLQF